MGALNPTESAGQAFRNIQAMTVKRANFFQPGKSFYKYLLAIQAS